MAAEGKVFMANLTSGLGKELGSGGINGFTITAGSEKNYLPFHQESALLTDSPGDHRTG